MFHRSADRLAVAGFTALSIFVTPVAAMAQAQGSAATSAPPTRAQLSTQLDANFKTVDTNGDKSLNAAEIDAAQKRTIAEAQGVMGKRVEAEFAKLDSNKDGQLSLTEFKAGVPGPRATPAAELISQFDSNKDGKVTADEYRARPLASFDRLDTNKDGTLSAQEQSAAQQQQR